MIGREDQAMTTPVRRSGAAWRAWLLGWTCGVTAVAVVYVLLK
jgi:hypothetical protein